MILQNFFHKRHQFRLALVGHKAAEVASACLLLMAQGQIAQVTLGHVAIASETGLLAVAPLVGITLTRFARHFANRWSSAAFVAVCTFFADGFVHGSHYPGAYTEAALTAAGAFVLSVIVSFTPIGRRFDQLAEGFLHHGPTVEGAGSKAAI
ncbi:MAG TPA: hypothetical protein VFY29_01080 [Terriglobia bacterium]|nr:hypothetical protein [Terriglobia bacterium]